jgi:anti-sigma factor RsiW
MNRCPEIHNVQDWLDGTLEPDAAARYEAHMAGCAECEAEAAAYRVVFAQLRALPLRAPSSSSASWTRCCRSARRSGLRVLRRRAAHRDVAAIGSAFVLPARARGCTASSPRRAAHGTGTFVLRSLSDGLRAPASRSRAAAAPRSRSKVDALANPAGS